MESKSKSPHWPEQHAGFAPRHYTVMLEIYNHGWGGAEFWLTTCPQDPQLVKLVARYSQTKLQHVPPPAHYQSISERNRAYQYGNLLVTHSLPWYSRDAKIRWKWANQSEGTRCCPIYVDDHRWRSWVRRCFHMANREELRRYSRVSISMSSPRWE